MTEPPVVRTRAEIDEHATEQVRVTGRYTQIDVRQRPSPPAAYQGHVALVLDDGAKVLLYPVWHREAKRPADEIARLEEISRSLRLGRSSQERRVARITRPTCCCPA